MSYRWCAVPHCTNTSIKTPEKMFVSVPKNGKRRKQWLKLARRDLKSISDHSTIFFCEDHFDMEKDMANYYQFKMGFSQNILMVPGATPSKFQCQKVKKRKSVPKRKNDKILCDSSTQEVEIKLEFEEFEETPFATDVAGISSPDDNNKVLLKAIKLECPWQKCDKETITEPLSTADKCTQLTAQVPTSNKAVQCKIETKDISVSPTDIPHEIYQARSLILKIYKYLEKEYRQMNKMYKGKLDLTALSKVKTRVAAATGVSQQDLARILEEEKERRCVTKPVPPRKRRKVNNRKVNSVESSTNPQIKTESIEITVPLSPRVSSPSRQIKTESMEVTEPLLSRSTIMEDPSDNLENMRVNE